MTIKASGCSALILAAGLFVGFAAPSRAATGVEDAAADSKSQNTAAVPVALRKNPGHGSHHRKATAHGKFHKVAMKTAGHNKAAAAPEVAAGNSEALPDLPPRVANANAQLPFPGAPVGNANAMAARANDLLQAAADSPADARAGNEADHETFVVAADQLNDVDRALHGGNPPAAASVMASANPPAAPALAGSQDSSTWDETSLIGKIFIGFGALLTMASAARMFMA